MIHSLKTKAEYFEAVANGEKTFEVRINDRPFAVNDFLALNETGDLSEYTGRCLMVKITYILDNSEYCKEDTVTMGIEPCMIRDRSDSMSYNMEFQSRSGIPIYERKQTK